MDERGLRVREIDFKSRTITMLTRIAAGLGEVGGEILNDGEGGWGWEGERERERERRERERERERDLIGLVISAFLVRPSVPQPTQSMQTHVF
jgi:hypothetical protein